MNPFWSRAMITLIAILFVECNLRQVTATEPILKISPDQKDAPKIILINNKPLNIQMLKKQQPIYLSRHLPGDISEPNRLEYATKVLVGNTKPSQAYEVRNLDYLHNRPNSMASKGMDRGQLSILQGMQKLVRQSNDRVIGRLNNLENRLDEVILERNSIIGAINNPQAQESTRPPSVTAATYLSTESLQGATVPNQGIYSSKPITLLGNVIRPGFQPQQISCSLIQGENGPKCIKVENSMLPQSFMKNQVDRAVSDTQRRIDSLQAVMLARQRKLILSRLARDYNLGQMDHLQGGLPFQNYPSLHNSLKRVSNSVRPSLPA